MSLWWREQLAVGFAPDRVSVRRLSRGPRRRELDATNVAVIATVPDWRATGQAFAAMLDTAGWRNADVEIVLSNHFVQYLVLPWVENLSAADAFAFAQHQLQTMFGAAEGWAITVGRAAAGLPRIAAAVESVLIEELRTMAAAHGLRVTGVRPLLAAACELLPSNATLQQGWLAVVEPARMSVSRLERGHCVSVRSGAYNGDAAKSLLTLLEQDALCAGIGGAAATLYLQAGDVLDCTLLREHGWQVLPSKLQVLQ